MIYVTLEAAKCALEVRFSPFFARFSHVFLKRVYISSHTLPAGRIQREPYRRRHRAPLL